MAIRIKKQRVKKLLAALDVVLVATLLCAAVALAVILINYEKDKATYREAAAIANVETEAAAPTEKPALQLSESWEPAREKPPITVDLAALMEKAPRVRAWIYSADTPINYPVVYYTNNSYYLTHAYDGTKSDGGALFFDCRCGRELTDQNLIIYGHHMKNDTMFGSLLNYQKQDYFDAHPCLYLLTEEQNYRVDVFAAWPSDSEGENFPVWFGDEAARRQFYHDATVRSAIDCGAEYRANDQMISLVTCSYDGHYDDAKFQVNGWLTPID